jgi:hypothetical protein
MGYPEDNFKGAKGKRFGDGQTREGNGRKPGIYKLTEPFDISATDINNIFKNVVIPHTLGELQEMVSEKKAKDLPAFEAMIISALLQDTKKGSLISLMQILDRVIGKPTQRDIVEFSDMPDTAKDRLNKIFGDAQAKSEKIKPKTVSGKNAGEKRERRKKRTE